jgi:hypothetical protein
MKRHPHFTGYRIKKDGNRWNAIEPNGRIRYSSLSKEAMEKRLSTSIFFPVKGIYIHPRARA